MGHECIFLCSGVNPPGITNRPNEIERLNLWKSKDGINVTLPVSDLDQKFWRDISPASLDLIEIAAYVYTADQAVGRGGKDVETFGGGWRRSFVFHIPVRMTELWQSPKVTRILTETLAFLSDDFYEFHFYPAQGAPAYQQYLNFSNAAGKSFQPQQVVLYSGGLDSLAGAITEILDDKQRVVLVSHRPTHKFRLLREEMAQKLADKGGDLAPLYVPVRIHKDSEMGVEPTQRSRSFLYAALAATVAQMVGLDEIRFYENGVVSLNLPPCEQIIGARATRTTHPKVLHGFQALFTEVSGRKFSVVNPYAWKTKGEILKVILGHHCGGLIKPSRSCASTWERSNEHTHCGICSQCVDRRVAMIATGAEEFDPVSQYEVDIVRETVPDEKERLMMVAYFERANEFRNIKTAGQLLEKYPEVAEALHYSNQSADWVISKILDLYQRHAVEVRKAGVMLIQRHADELLGRTLPADCLVRILNDTNSATVLPAVEVKAVKAGEPAAATVQIKPLGKRCGYIGDYETVCFDKVFYDLSARPKARACIKLLAERESFCPKTALHFERVIDPHVRAECKLGPLAPNAEVKPHHYFNPSKGRIARLGRELVVSAGDGSGSYYLNVN